MITVAMLADSLNLHYESMIAAAAAVRRFLWYDLSVSSEDSAQIYENKKDDPLPENLRDLNVYYHVSTKTMYMWLRATLQRGTVESVRPFVPAALRKSVIAKISDKWKLQSKAAEAKLFVITTLNAAWSSVVPPAALSDADDNKTIGVCLIFKDVEPWPAERVEVLSQQRVQFLSTQNMNGIDLDWSGATGDDIERPIPYVIDYSNKEEPDRYVFEDYGMRIGPAIFCDNPIMVLGVDLDTNAVVMLRLNDTGYEVLDEDAVRELALSDEALPFTTDLIDAVREFADDIEVSDYENCLTEETIAWLVDQVSYAHDLGEWPTDEEVIESSGRVPEMFADEEPADGN